MPADPITQRRSHGSFQRSLQGVQPQQAHARLQRFGRPLQPLSVANARGLLSVLLLASTTRPATAARPPSAASAGDATRYSPVSTAGVLTATAASGCLARPGSCPQLVAGTLLGGVGGLFAGAWLGWWAQPASPPCHAADPSPRTAAQRAGMHFPPDAHTTPPAPTTETPVGPDAAGFTLADLDPAQDPCQSLYAYVNTRWANATALSAHQSRWHTAGMLEERSLAQQRALAEALVEQDTRTPAQQVVADLWTSGMDEAHINADHLGPLRRELAAIDALDSSAAIAAHLRLLTAQGRNPVFGFAVEPDMDERTTLMAYAFQGGLGLPDPNYYSDVRGDDIRTAYRTHIIALLQLSGVSADQASADATALFALERRLAAASMAKGTLDGNLAAYYCPVSPAQADALTPHFNWTALFDTLGVAVPARFSLAMPNFHREVSAALGDTDPSVWRAYLRFHCLDLASPYLCDAFAEAAHAFHQGMFKLDRPLPPRWKRVLAAIDAHAGDAMSEVYAAAHFPPRAKARVEQMVEHLRNVLKRRLATLPWMDEATRGTAQAKADQLDPRIGHPETWPDWSGLRTSRCGYLDNLRQARAFQQRAKITRIGQPVEQRPARLRAHAVDAHFDVLNNDMAFSAALLQPPYFDPDADDALNYGALGVTIGHEMAHAFSAETSQFAPDRRLRLWWSEQDLNRYADLSQRLARQFDAQKIDGLAVNGTLTANENMADLGGLLLALEALRDQSGARNDPMVDGLSREQRFFISWALINRRKQTPHWLALELQADPHALGAPRADVGPSNLPAFAEAFQCANNTPMARSDFSRVDYL